MTNKNTKKYDPIIQECKDYQAIQAVKNSSSIDMEAAEEAGCDSCVHHNNGKCGVYVRKSKFQ